ncbi:MULTISPECIES: flagellar transcriptional regulator FlhD [unclassified Caballeronia]|uniref:flagellar transcriptional regulator FlhD n=1 Tax=unclassified Caballeronia TaxID=2646786 RepID=UPI0028606FD2|nr:MULTISPECIES: flagellar transcriptional regulator FlhD [unclassified Caballeronia]MDR5740517.1 flagellar transcriptional regulator FlhD [Caballeronia sp. LZ016]MDR5808963.1 flagellar transcriptional regulator FlhD [Caballeronia sp. LZ019]
MTNLPESLAQIRELNLAYLLLARRLLHEDRIMAMYRLGLDDTAARIISTLTAAQTRRLSESTELVWQFRIDDVKLLSTLIDGHHVKPLSHLHVSIVLGEEACKRRS